MKNALSLTLVLALTACTSGMRPGTGSGDGGLDASIWGPNPEAGDPRINYATIRGTAWAPGNAPGMVPAGHEIPIFDALIRVTPARVRAIPDMVYCESCESVSGPNARSAHDGTFEVGGIVPGNYWLTIEKGQFRIERELSLGEGEVLDLSATLTTLPSVHDPARGQTVPSIAIGTGSYDQLEDVLGKMGVGTVDSSGDYSIGTGSDRIHWYGNGGDTYRGEMGSLESLVRDLSRMMRYHIIFIPCSGDDNVAALQDQAVLRNIRAYVEAGGKLYVTDWSGEWMDNVFPAFIDLEGPGTDTPASAYDATANRWNTGQFGNADGSLYTSENAEVVDPDLFTWLDGQTGPTPDGAIATYNAGSLTVVDNFNTILGLNRIQVGFDAEGLPVTDMPVGYVIGGQGTETPKRPLTVTFEPAGCGRVLFSTYHTTGTPHVGLVPQERILLYLIMEIGVCKEGPILI